MSEYDREIVEAIRKAAGTELKDDINIIQATVTNVYTPQSYTCDCTPVSGDTTDNYLGVSLSVNCNDSFILVPAKDSVVLLAVSTKNNPPYIVGYDTLQGVICVVQNPDQSVSQLVIQNEIIQISNTLNNTSLQILIQNGQIQLSNNTNGTTQQILIQNGTIQLNDGSDGGLVQVINLTTKLNNLENLLNSLISSWNDFCNVYKPGSPSTTGLPSSLSSSTQSTLTATVRGDIENTSITHGV